MLHQTPKQRSQYISECYTEFSKIYNNLRSNPKFERWFPYFENINWHLSKLRETFKKNPNMPNSCWQDMEHIFKSTLDNFRKLQETIFYSLDSLIFLDNTLKISEWPKKLEQQVADLENKLKEDALLPTEDHSMEKNAQETANLSVQHKTPEQRSQYINECYTKFKKMYDSLRYDFKLQAFFPSFDFIKKALSELRKIYDQIPNMSDSCWQDVERMFESVVLSDFEKLKKPNNYTPMTSYIFLNSNNIFELCNMLDEQMGLLKEKLGIAEDHSPLEDLSTEDVTQDNEVEQDMEIETKLRSSEDPFFQKIAKEVLQPLKDREKRLEDKYKSKDKSDVIAIRTAREEVENACRIAYTQSHTQGYLDSTAIQDIKKKCKEDVISAIKANLIDNKVITNERSTLGKLGRILINVLNHIYIAPALEKWAKSGHTYVRINTKSQSVVGNVYNASKKLKP